MFKKPTKRQSIIRRTLLAIVATISVGIVLTVSILFLLGYRLDSGNGRLEQGALLQFDSIPGGATVTVDGKELSGKTATKLTTIAGTRQVQMSKDGYENWVRSLTVEAGTLTWLNYARLVPTVRTIQPVLTYNQLSQLVFSPDNRWALVIEQPTSPVLRLVDIRSDQVSQTTLTIPDNLFDQAGVANVEHNFRLIRWSENGRHALLTHSANGQTEWLLIDTQNISSSINITKLFSVSFSDIKFAGTSGSSLFGLSSDGILRKLDVGAGTISRSLISRVESFDVFDNSTISFVGQQGTEPSQRVAGTYKDGEEGPLIVRTEADLSLPVHIAVGRSFNNDYVALSVGSQVHILSGNYSASGSAGTNSLQDYDSFNASGNVEFLSFSPESAFLVAQSGKQFLGYELEHRRHENSEIVVGGGASSVNRLNWLGDAQLWNDDGGALIMRDFNGLNAHTIMTVEPGFNASLSQNDRYIYAVGKSDGNYRLQRVRMIIS